MDTVSIAMEPHVVNMTMETLKETKELTRKQEYLR